MKVLPRIPESIQPKPPNVGWLLGIDVEGRLVHNFQDFGGSIQRVTGARRLKNSPNLVLTSDFAKGIAFFKIPTREPSAEAIIPPVEDGDQP